MIIYKTDKMYREETNKLRRIEEDTNSDYDHIYTILLQNNSLLSIY